MSGQLYPITSPISCSPLTLPKNSITFNTWYEDCVSNQLKWGVAPGNAKVLLKMSDLKPLYALWIVEMYDYLRQQIRSIINVFDKAGIKETEAASHRYF